MSKNSRIIASRRQLDPYPRLDEVLDRRILSRHISAGNIKAATHPTLSLWVYNYTASCARNGRFDEVTTLTRGLVRDNKGRVIARGFGAFFSWGERGRPRAGSWEGDWYALEKVDGTMVTASNLDGKLLLATRGSFDAWQLARVQALWPGGLPEAGETWVLEYVGPDNLIVVPYDSEGVYALGVIDNATGADKFSRLDDLWRGGFLSPRRYEAATPERLLGLAHNDGSSEGYVVIWPRRDKPSGRLKVKYPSYQALVRTKMRGERSAVPNKEESS